MKEKQRRGPGSVGTEVWIQGAGKPPGERPEKSVRVGLCCEKETGLNP